MAEPNAAPDASDGVRTSWAVTSEAVRCGDGEMVGKLGAAHD